MQEHSRKAKNDAFGLNIWWALNILMAALNNGQFGLDVCSQTWIMYVTD